MDISIPKMDGWEATQRLKADESTRAIPIIALTAHALEEDRQKAIAGRLRRLPREAGRAAPRRAGGRALRRQGEQLRAVTASGCGPKNQ
jgi:CheY-like chemotaxis protein